MTGYELLLSESQERMLLVVRAGPRGGGAPGVRALRAARGDDRPRDRRARHPRHATAASSMCEVPGRALADDAPRYVPPAAPPADLELRRAERLDDLAAEPPDGATLLELLASPNVRSRRPVWRRYDHMNGTNTLVGPGDGDAALLRVKGTPRALALSLDGPGRLGALDPRLAGAAAVLEGALNVACIGRRADRHHQLPELRLAGDAGGLLAAGRGRGRHGRRLSRPRHARSSPATSASTTRRRMGRSCRPR